MQKELGQPWLIDPRPGANGIMAAQMFLGAPVDGYTLFLTVSGHVALPFLMKVPYEIESPKTSPRRRGRESFHRMRRRCSPTSNAHRLRRDKEHA
jgi:hypothetical protein